MQCHLINQVHVDRYQSIYLEMNELVKRVSPVHLLGWHCQHISDIRQATTSIAHFCIGLQAFYFHHRIASIWHHWIWNYMRPKSRPIFTTYTQCSTLIVGQYSTVQYSTVQYSDTLDTKSKYEINSCNYGWPGRARAQYPAIASQNKICSSCPPPIHEKSLAQSFMHGASKLFPRFLEQPPPTNQLPDYLNMFLYWNKLGAESCCS